MSTLKSCPDGKVLNLKTNRCNKVKTVTVKKTKTADCKEGKVKNPKTGRCVKSKTVKVKSTGCPDGKVLNPNTNRCIKVKQGVKETVKIPEPANIPTDFTKNQLDTMLSELIETGLMPIKQKYDGFGFFQDIYLMYLIKKYKATCYAMNIVTYSSGRERPTYVNTNPNKPPTKDDTDIFVGKLFNCISSKKFPVIIAPIKIVEDSEIVNHYNVLIYRRDRNQFEHFEPHGKYYKHNETQSETIAKHIKLYIDALNAMTGKRIGLLTSEQVCPMLHGFQTLEEWNKSKESINKLYEPGGYCSIWGLFFIELVLKNPSIPSDELIRSVINKVKATNLIDLARGYMAVVCNKLQQYYTVLTGKPMTTTEIMNELTTNLKSDMYGVLIQILNFEKKLEMIHDTVTSEIYARSAKSELKAIQRLNDNSERSRLLMNYFKNYSQVFTPSPSSIKKCPPGKELNVKTGRCNKITSK